MRTTALAVHIKTNKSLNTTTEFFPQAINTLRSRYTSKCGNRQGRAAGLFLLLWIGLSAPATALDIFETPGLTLGNDAVECIDVTHVNGNYRKCESDALSERLLSHNGQPMAERTPLDFHLLLPELPAGDDGNYPLVVFIHGWNGHKDSNGGGVESEHIPYVQGGYAVLAYSARAWGDSCGSAQQFSPDCTNGWNHLADARYEVRDTQYFTGLLVDELSDDGTPLVDPMRIGVTGVSYGGGQSTMLTSLRNRVVETDGTVNPWVSPGGTPMQIAAAAPYWAWTDLSYSLTPNGRNLDYVSNNSYYGPANVYPVGVLKTSFVGGLYGTGQANSNYAEPPNTPDITGWNAVLIAGEPYLEATVKPITDEVNGYRSGYYWLDPAVEPAPTLFNSGWSDDIFPVDEPLRWIHAATAMHPDLEAALYATDYGHARTSSVDAAVAKASVRAWFDYHLKGEGSPAPAVRAKTQDCDGNGAMTYSGDRWSELMPGELRMQDPIGGIVLSSSAPNSLATQSFDPISGGNACSTVPDAPIANALVYDFPIPENPGGYTVLGSPTIIADIEVTVGNADDSILIARLLDIHPNGTERLLARGAYRPDPSGTQVFQMHPIAAYIDPTHHLQIELVGNENPSHRKSNVEYTLTITNLDLRVPLRDFPNGMDIQKPAEKMLPAGLILADMATVSIPMLPGLAIAGLLGLFAVVRHKRVG